MCINMHVYHVGEFALCIQSTVVVSTTNLNKLVTVIARPFTAPNLSGVTELLIKSA